MPKRGPLLALFLVPLLVVGPSLLRGRWFLPQVPAAIPPLSEENPGRAARAVDGQSYPEADRLFPTLTDQLAMARELRNGHLPLWEPLFGLGAPLFAQSIAGAAYPPNWLAFLLPPERAAAPLAILSIFLAGLGAWLFLGRQGLGPPAVLVGTLAYQLGGWGLANLFDFMKFDAALWLPFALWAVDGIRMGRRWSGLALSLSLAFSLLAGMPGVGLLVGAMTALYAVVRLSPLSPLRSDDEEERRPVSRSSGRLHTPHVLPPYLTAGLFALLGIGAAAVWLLPLAEASRESSRQEASVEVLRDQALPTSALLGTVVANLAGSPLEATAPGNLPIVWWLTPPSRVNAALAANQLEWTTYAGAVVVALAIVGLVSTPRRAALPAFLLLVALGFACGWPLLRALYHLPGLHTGIPTRSLALAWFLWPWLAALGADALGRDLPRARATLVGVGLALAATALLLFQRTEPSAFADRLDRSLVERYESLHSPADVRARFSVEESRAAASRVRCSSAVLAGLAAVLAAGALIALGRRGPRPWLTGGTLAVLVLVDGGFATGSHFTGRPAEGPIFPRSPTIAAIAEAAGGGRVLRLDESESGREDVLALARPNLLEPYGVADLTPWIVFPPRTTNELFAAFDPPSRNAQGVSRLSDAALLDHPVLDLLRVTCILSRRPIEHPRLEEVFARPGFHVYRRDGALRPARLVPHAIPSANDAAVLSVLSAGALDPTRETLLAAGEDSSGSDTIRSGPDGRRASTGRIVSVAHPSAGVVRIELDDIEGGWLVLHEQAFPGWKAEIDGREVEVRRADQVYRAVPLRAGDRVVTFRYAPTSFRLGTIVTLASLLTALFLSRRLSS